MKTKKILTKWLDVVLLLACLSTLVYARQTCDHCVDPNDPSKGCREGWFPASTPSPCSSECPDACTACQAIDNCSYCKDQFSLVDKLCCPENCVACSVTGRCSSCKTGFHGNNCALKCSVYCDSPACDQSTGSCNCTIGLYRSTCSNSCPSNCGSSGCSETGKCFSCADERWQGETCGTSCYGNCEGGTCHQNGTCKTGCTGLFHGDICDTPCNSHCKNGCDRSGVCLGGCDTGYHGDYCSDPCSQYCEVATGCGRNGSCIQCQGHRNVNCKGGCARDDGTCQECAGGFHGIRCEHSCSDTCKSLNGVVVCDKDSGQCLNGCTEGYHGDTCQSNCPTGCKRCDNDTYCSGCNDNKRWGDVCEKPCSQHCGFEVCEGDGTCTRGCALGYYGDQCTQECNKVIPDCRECSRDGQKCLDCLSAKFGEQCDRTCPDHCLECNSDGRCVQCEDGRYGDNCEGLCPVGCESCYSDGRCWFCEDGMYGYGDKCEQCPVGCTECLSKNNCMFCENGKYGAVCEHSCSVGCERCDSDGRCWLCEDGKYGDNCEHSCLAGCERCDSDGRCLLCVDGRYGDNCEHSCLAGCERCDSDGRCWLCEDGKYGDNCEHSCPASCSSCTALRSGSHLAECLRCHGGYYLSGLQCVPCPYTCELCSGPESCSKCKGGFHGSECQQGCPANCIACLSDTNCTACKPGWSGELCNCNTNCIYTETFRCSYSRCPLGCTPGTYGVSCSMVCRNQNCERCDQRSGDCESDSPCKKGWYGPKCMRRCSANCEAVSGSVVECNKDTGGCSLCRNSSYGDGCQNQCNQFCRDPLGQWACDKMDGACYSCAEGFYGTRCEQNCSVNCTGGCNKTSGECVDTAGSRTELGSSTELGPSTDPGPNTGLMTSTYLVPSTELVPSTDLGPSTDLVPSTELGLNTDEVVAVTVASVIVLIFLVGGILYMKRGRRTCYMNASTGGRQELPLHTLKGGAKAQGNASGNAEEPPEPGPMEEKPNILQQNPEEGALGADVQIEISEDVGSNAAADLLVDGNSHSINQNIEVVADLQLYKDRLLSDERGTPVYEGVFEGSISVAVKKIHLTGPKYTNDLNDHVRRLREVETLRKMPGYSHENTVRYLKSEMTSDFLYIAFELCQGTLEDYVDIQKSWSEELPWKHALTQMAKGLQFLHGTVNIAHRDLKPSNVLLFQSTFVTKVVLADFGQSKMMVNMQCSMTGATGSLGWIAPEADANQDSYFTDSDIFSLGCLFYYVATKGNHPFGQYPLQRQNNISQNKSDLSILQPCLGCLRELITDMIQVKHEDRPSAKQVSEHPSLMDDGVIMDFLHKASNKINGYPLSQQNILEDPNIIPGGNWVGLLPINTQTYLATFRLRHHKQPMFQGKEGSVRHLLRAIRNCSEHFPDLAAAVRAEIGATTPDHVEFWLGCYPWILTHVYDKMKGDTSLMDSIRKS